MERSILKLRLRDKKKNTEIRENTKIIDALQHAKKLKWKWAGHVARLKDQRWTKHTTEWSGPGGTRGRGRPRERWADEIAVVAGTDWKKKTQDREHWKSLEEAFTRRGVLN